MHSDCRVDHTEVRSACISCNLVRALPNYSRVRAGENAEMGIWLIRAGQHGEREEAALARGMAIIGWEELPDLSPVKTREALAQLLKDTYPDEGPNKLAN